MRRGQRARQRKPTRHTLQHTVLYVPWVYTYKHAVSVIGSFVNNYFFAQDLRERASRFWTTATSSGIVEQRPDPHNDDEAVRL